MFWVTMCTSKCWATIGAILAGLSVAAGAFGAHGLDSHFHHIYKDKVYEKKVTSDGSEIVLSRQPLAEKYLADFKTGAAPSILRLGIGSSASIFVALVDSCSPPVRIERLQCHAFVNKANSRGARE